MAEDDLRRHFDEGWEDYDARIRTLVPRYDELHEAILLALPFPSDAAARVLDLGTGTGELARKVLEGFPHVTVVGVDFAGSLLEAGRKKLAAFGDRVRLVAADYQTVDLDGPFDATVSALSIHHLDGDAKGRLFRRVHGLLRPGGVFANGDYVVPPAAWLEARYRALREAHLRAAGLDEATVAGHRRDSERYDRPSTLADQMAWLREAGFGDIECLWKHYDLAVYAGTKVGEDGGGREGP